MSSDNTRPFHDNPSHENPTVESDGEVVPKSSSRIIPLEEQQGGGETELVAPDASISSRANRGGASQRKKVSNSEGNKFFKQFKIQEVETGGPGGMCSLTTSASCLPQSDEGRGRQL
jgi:hypothetical protein